MAAYRGRRQAQDLGDSRGRDRSLFNDEIEHLLTGCGVYFFSHLSSAPTRISRAPIRAFLWKEVYANLDKEALRKAYRSVTPPTCRGTYGLLSGNQRSQGAPGSLSPSQPRPRAACAERMPMTSTGCAGAQRAPSPGRQRARPTRTPSWLPHPRARSWSPWSPGHARGRRAAARSSARRGKEVDEHVPARRLQVGFLGEFALSCHE